MSYGFKFRRLESYTAHHISKVKEINPDFNFNNPWFINWHLKKEIATFLHDGEYLVILPENMGWGRGLSFSDFIPIENIPEHILNDVQNCVFF